MTEHCSPSAHITVKDEGDGEGGNREREDGRDALFLAFLGRSYLFGLSPPPRWEDDCPESFHQRRSGSELPLRPHPHYIRLGGAMTKEGRSMKNTPSRSNPRIHRGLSRLAYRWVNTAHSTRCVCRSCGAFLLFPAVLLSSFEQTRVCWCLRLL